MRAKFKTALSAFPFIAYIAWDNFGKPIWSVNVERWAEQRSLDQALNENIDQISVPVIPEWVVEWINFLTGDFMIGAATLGLFLLSVDIIRWCRLVLKKPKNDVVDHAELAEKCRFLARMIRANEQFFGNQYVDFTDLKLEVWDAAQKIGYVINKNFIDDVISKPLSAWPDILQQVCAELDSNNQKSAGNIEKIISEFMIPQLQKDFEEETKP
jgi:hypothetical protein